MNFFLGVDDLKAVIMGLLAIMSLIFAFQSLPPPALREGSLNVSQLGNSCLRLTPAFICICLAHRLSRLPQIPGSGKRIRNRISELKRKLM
jgi:hypothetical protein